MIELLRAITPQADDWRGPLEDACFRYAINTPERQIAFLAQCAHESASFTRLEEDLHYSAARLLQIWPSRFTPEDALRMAYDERAIAERAYGGRMGNLPEGEGEGYKYRGRGLLQITGRDGYLKAGNALGVDFVSEPDLVAQPTFAALTAAAFWSRNGCNELADDGRMQSITLRINGGLNGQNDRLAWMDRLRAVA